MTTIKEIYEYLNEVAPFELQEDNDNAGIILGDPQKECTGIVICLDSTEDIIDEAISLGCNTIIAHHPIIFRGLKRLNQSNYVERTVVKAIKNDIAIIAIHTNLDNVLNLGVNQKIAEKLGLKNIGILSPKAHGENKDIGAGIIGELSAKMEEKDFLSMLKSTMKCGIIRHTKLLGRPIESVAVCGGSGSFLLPLAMAKNADIFITSDFKYHEFFDADNQIVIADIGHYESEQYTIELLNDIIKRKFTTFASHCTKCVTNPIKYF